DARLQLLLGAAAPGDFVLGAQLDLRLQPRYAAQELIGVIEGLLDLLGDRRIVDHAPEGALALVDLAGDASQVGHGFGEVVEGVAQGALLARRAAGAAGDRAVDVLGELVEAFGHRCQVTGDAAQIAALGGGPGEGAADLVDVADDVVDGGVV